MLGVLSLIVWTLTLIVSVKYLVYVMRADNRGEGGILAMLALILQKDTKRLARRSVLIALGLFGAALLYGDGVITPAISVLGAMEGLIVVSPAFTYAVVPATIAVLEIQNDGRPDFAANPFNGPAPTWDQALKLLCSAPEQQTAFAAWAACVLAKRCWNLSTRPAVSTNFCCPV